MNIKKIKGFYMRYLKKLFRINDKGCNNIYLVKIFSAILAVLRLFNLCEPKQYNYLIKYLDNDDALYIRAYNI